MKLDYKKAIISSLNYSINIRKLPYYFLFQIFALLIIFFPLLNLIEVTYDSGLFDNPTPDPQLVDFIVESFGYFFLAIVLVLIISSVLTPTFIYDYSQYRSKKKDSLRTSLEHSKPYILTVFGAFITLAFLVNIISGIISMISQTLGSLVSLIMSLAFLFVIQEIIIKKSSISKSLTSSYTYARRNIMPVIIVYLTSVLFSVFIIILFAIPLISVLSNSILPIDSMIGSGVSYGALIASFASQVKSDIALYLVSITVLLLGTSIGKLFGIGFTTDIYIQLSKK